MLNFEKRLVDFGGDGYTAEEIFKGGKSCAAYTYDDLILLPGFHFFWIDRFSILPYLSGHINFGLEEISLETEIARGFKIKVD